MFIASSPVTGIIQGMVRSIVGGVGGANPLVFHAADDVDGVFNPGVIIGVGDITEARTGSIWLINDSGVWVEYATTVPGEHYAGGKWWLHGQPAHTNQITQSFDLTDAAWVEVAGTANDLVTNGDFTADSDWDKGTGWDIDSTTAGKAHAAATTDFLSQDIGTPTVGKTYKITYTVSGYVSGSVRAIYGQGTAGAIHDADGAYVDYITVTSAADPKLYLDGVSAFTGDIDDVQVFEAVAQLDAVGLRGDANGASTLTDNDGSGFEAVVESVTVPDDSNVHVWRILLNKDTDETRFPEFQCLLTGGTDQLNYVQINTKTGALNERTTTGTVASEANQVGDKWELLISVANNGTANVAAQIALYPARGATLGGNDVSATGSIVVGNVSLHLNTSISAVRGSGAIFTSGSTITTNATDLSFNDANHDDSSGLWVCDFRNAGINAPNGGLLGLGVSGRFITMSSTTNFRSDDGPNAASGPAVTLNADDTEYLNLLAYGDSLMRMRTDGAWGTAVTYDGEFNNDNSKIKVLTDNGTASTPPATLLIREIKRHQQSYTAAIAKAEELSP